MAKPDQTRRQFLFTLIALLGGLLALGRFLSPRVARRRTLVRAAKGELPVKGALVYREARVALMRDGDAVYALSLVCTHLGCTVQVTPTGLGCPCHGSSFDRQGGVLKGPATRPLERYRVETHGDHYEVVV